ncbi:MAG: SCP2 sterol-binding domain-containing protein [Chloroflexi bacterium]|nr:SCP2 sterol-binding domain-containing protein [Chloroflexota bacterium]
MVPPDDLTCRDAIRGMPLAFNPHAARGLRATIQFCFSGAEPGNYYLHIAGGECTFYEGRAHRPDVSIHASSEVWLAICRGEIDGGLAFLRGRYRAEGNLWLLMRLRSLFPPL